MRQLEHFQNLVVMFFARARQEGDKPFLWAKKEGAWRSISWRETADKVARLAAAQASASACSAAMSAFQSWNWTLPVCPPGSFSMPITASQLFDRIAAGSSVLASFWVETTTARAPLSSRIC